MKSANEFCLQVWDETDQDWTHVLESSRNSYEAVLAFAAGYRDIEKMRIRIIMISQVTVMEGTELKAWIKKLGA